jgi:hypothetical protein
MKIFRLFYILFVIVVFSSIIISCAYVGGDVDDYEERLSKFISFYNEVYDIEEKYIEDTNDLIIQFNNNIDNPQDQIQYAELLIDKYSAWYNDLSLIKVPEFLMDFFSDRLEFLGKTELAFRIYVDAIKNNDTDGLNEFDKISSEAQTLYIKSSKEIEIIIENFNNEAKKLGLSKPFPDKD